MAELNHEVEKKLEKARNIWFGSVRKDGRPHLAPVWFVYYEGKLYLGTDPKSVKITNIRANPNVVLALEEGDHPVICEGTATILQAPLNDGLKKAFFDKYEWNMDTEEQFNLVVEVTARKWLHW